MGNPILNTLRKSAKGLMYMSEKDAPFQVFSYEEKGEINLKRFLQKVNHSGETAEEVKLESFFAGLTQDQKWHSADEKAVTQRFINLVKVLKESLDGIKVIKTGQAKKKVYIVGQTKDGSWAGLQTEALET